MKIRNLVGVTAVLCLMLAASPGQAAPPGSAPAQARSGSDETDAMAAWLPQIMGWSQQYVDLVRRRNEQVAALMEGGDRLLDFLKDDKTAEARTWATQWAAETRTSILALDAVYPTLPVDPPQPPASITSARSRDVMRMQVDVRDRIGTHLRQTREMSDRFIDLVVAASSGEDADLKALGLGYFELGIAGLESEALMMENARPKEGELGYYFSVAVSESDRSALAWMYFVQAHSLGRPVDDAAMAEDLRTHNRAAMAATADLKTHGAQWRAQIEHAAELNGTPLRETLLFAADSIAESAGIEEQIQQRFEHLADLVAAGDHEASVDAYDPIAALVDERTRVDRARRARLTGAQ